MLTRNTTQLSDNIDNTNDNNIISILQFNILADILSGDHIDKGNFAYNTELLDWNIRKIKIFNEIQLRNCDIITLEELDIKHQNEFNLELNEYSHIFCNRLSGFEHSIALYYKRNKLLLIKYERLYYLPQNKQNAIIAMFKLINEENKNENNEEKDIINDDIKEEEVHNINNINNINISNNDKYIIIGMTHLISKKTIDGEEKRVNQINQLLEIILNFQNELINDYNINENNISILLSGDFNASYNQSEDYEDQCIKSILSYNNINFNTLYPTNEEYTTFKIRNNNKTNKKKGSVKHTIDWIFYNSNLLPLSRLEMPLIDDIGEEGLPNQLFPSDHMSINGEFMIL